MRKGMIKRKNPVIALAQIRYYDTAEKNNIAKIKRYIQLAKRRGADIICFPETCIHKTDVLPLNHKLVKEIQRACKENSIWAIVTDSFVIKREPYKIALLIDREGKIRGKYKKINLYDDKTKRGKKIFVYKTDFAKIGIAICWDLAFPDLFRRMKLLGGEIVFCPSKWCYETLAHTDKYRERELVLLKSLITSRAFENFYFVALCNPITNQKDLISYSAISSPHKIIAEIKNREGLISAEINLEEIRKLEKLYNKSR